MQSAHSLVASSPLKHSANHPSALFRVRQQRHRAQGSGPCRRRRRLFRATHAGTPSQPTGLRPSPRSAHGRKRQHAFVGVVCPRDSINAHIIIYSQTSAEQRTTHNSQKLLTWSKSATVCRRCAMVKRVEPANSLRMICCRIASVWGSICAVGSS